MSDEREPPTPELNIDEKFGDRIRYLTRIAALERDLAAAQAEVTACAGQLERDRVTIGQQAQIIVDLKADAAALKQSINRFHHIMHKAGLHPGRTDDDLLEILERHFSNHEAAIKAAVTAEKKRCVDIINAYSTVCDRSAEMLAAIARGAAHD